MFLEWVNSRLAQLARVLRRLGLFRYFPSFFMILRKRVRLIW